MYTAKKTVKAIIKSESSSIFPVDNRIKSDKQHLI
jgi:hypothetical protein